MQTQPNKKLQRARTQRASLPQSLQQQESLLPPPGLQVCSFLATNAGRSHRREPRPNTTGGEALPVWFHFGKGRNHLPGRGGGNKSKSNQPHPPPERTAPSAPTPVTCLRPRRKGILQAHPPHRRMGRQEFKASQRPFPPLLWAACSSDPI